MFKIKKELLIGILITFLSNLGLNEVSHLRSFSPKPVMAKNKQLSDRVGKFSISYQPTTKASTYKFRLSEDEVLESPPTEHDQIKNLLEKKGIFDNIIDNLNNSGLVMRTDIATVFRDCGTPNAYWNSKDKEIIICYENITYDLALFQAVGKYSFEEALEKSINETIFVFYHELGHALIDVLPLAAVGQEEDTVDEFAAITLLKSNNEQNAQIVLDGAEFYQLKNGQPLWWDEHTPDPKRVFNIVCFVYGSNPTKYEKEFIETFAFASKDDNQVTEARIARRANLCKQDYANKVKKWDKLMIPHYAKPNPDDQDRPPNYPSQNGESRRGIFW